MDIDGLRRELIAKTRSRLLQEFTDRLHGLLRENKSAKWLIAAIAEVQQETPSGAFAWTPYRHAGCSGR
jgi:hypothetical protein